MENPKVTQEQKDACGESMKILDSFLEGHSWFAGEDVTLADLTILADVSQLKAMGYNMTPHTNLSKWLERCKNLPGYDENQKGADLHSKNFNEKLPNTF